MHRVAVLTLRGYREWTESLGPRREHKIQQIQATLHRALWKIFTSIGALPHHFRYDVMIALVNNIPDRSIEAAVAKFSKYSPVEVDFCIGSGGTPYEAYLNCGGVNKHGDTSAVVAHIDIVNSTHTTKNKGPLYVYTEILTMINALHEKCQVVGCIPFYLGGDNVMVYLPNPESISKLHLDVPYRAGVGVAKRPFNAFVKATKALDRLRSTNGTGVKIVK